MDCSFSKKKNDSIWMCEKCEEDEIEEMDSSDSKSDARDM